MIFLKTRIKQKSTAKGEKGSCADFTDNDLSASKRANKRDTTQEWETKRDELAWSTHIEKGDDVADRLLRHRQESCACYVHPRYTETKENSTV